MRTWRRLVIMLAVVGTAFLFYRWWQGASARADRRDQGASDLDEGQARIAAESRAGGAGARGGAPENGEGRSGPKLDRARADKMREQIRAFLAEGGPVGLLGEQGAAPSAAPAPSFPSMPVLPDAALGEVKVDPSYIQKRVREDLFPLARDCYAEAMKRDPKVAGKVVVAFSILGDHKVGGVVGNAKITDETTIADTEFQTCVRESMLSVSFDAPPDDGEITVVYPILFSPEDDEAGAGP